MPRFEPVIAGMQNSGLFIYFFLICCVWFWLSRSKISLSVRGVGFTGDGEKPDAVVSDKPHCPSAVSFLFSFITTAECLRHLFSKRSHRFSEHFKIFVAKISLCVFCAREVYTQPETNVSVYTRHGRCNHFMCSELSIFNQTNVF